LSSLSVAARLRLTDPRLLVLIVLSVLAFSTRVLPLSISPLPFNNDGMTEARIADDILSSEHLKYPEGSFYSDSYSVVTPVYNVLLAFAASSMSTDTFSASQLVIAAFSVLTVVGVYLVAIRITNNLTGSISAAFVLALLGTFVYLTGSAWKGALGIALLLLLTVAYINRSDRRFLVLELVILLILPLTYHLVTILAYLFVAYLTCWSILVAVMRGRVTVSHVFDAIIIGASSLIAYVYYLNASFQRLSDYGEIVNIAFMVLAFLALFLVAALALNGKGNGRRLSFAPSVGAIVVFVVFVDYFNPVFPYTQGFASYVLLVGLLYGLVVIVGWYGLERLTLSNSRYRAIPLGLLLPVLTIFLFALTSGLDLDGHKIFYRTFDYADISLALGAGVAIAYIKRTRIRTTAVVLLTAVLICSFPFGYATGTLLGDRHDSQEYEVDAITWVYDSSGPSVKVRSDERLSYNARALYDYGKDPYLPSRLASGDLSTSSVMNLFLEEWTVIGVNDYPRGHPILDTDYVESVLEISNVLYVGGPETNNIIVFQTSLIP
jgi:hypothetical protein